MAEADARAVDVDKFLVEPQLAKAKVNPSASGTWIGTISSTNEPVSIAFTAGWWLRTAQAS